jgi:tetratricopeptide (TPR) repeat protein
MKYLYLTVVIFFLFLPAAYGQNINELREKGFEAAYNLDYQTAERYFKEIVRLYPEHPAGPQFLAANLWLKTLNDSRRLQTSLYGSDSFYADNEDKADPQVVNQFRDWTRQAKFLAEARLKKDPRDKEALYFLGTTEGLKAAFAAAVERRFIAALREGSRSVDRHRDVLKIDPTFIDAELTIGLYDYVAGGLPLPIKILASVTGVRGSQLRGVETLKRVANKAQWASDDAKVLLIAIHKYEKRYKEALALTKELSSKYPRNYLFKLEVADSLVLQAAEERKTNPTLATQLEKEAFGIFNELLRNKTVRQVARSLDLIHYKYGEALQASGQLERAANEFLSAATATGAEERLSTMSYLRAAQTLDLIGRREKALANYRTVLQRPNVYDSRNQAERGIREPYKLKDS